MPELPEVETIKIGLSQKIVGLKIADIKVLSPKSFLGDKDELIEKKVLEVKRRAKILLIDLGDKKLLIHLKMSGQLILNGDISKSTRVIISFSDQTKLLFNDQRKFGWIKVVESEDHLKRLGPEPLEKDFNLETFKTQVQKRKNTSIKVALLDQKIIAGIGNIYAAEAVFISKIDPRRKVSDLSEKNLKDLHKAVIGVLQKGINLGGSSSVHFMNIEGVRGTFLSEAFVYKREYLPCKVCGTTLEKLKIGGRGTVFCPNCQK